MIFFVYRFLLNFFISYFFLLLCACSETANFAPVTDIHSIESLPQSGTHRVVKGETLYAIAWRYGMDYRYLAECNHIPSSYVIQAGQLIYLHERELSQAKINNHRIEKLVITEKKIVLAEPNFSTLNWKWPAKGKIIRTFSGSNKGVDIVSHIGEPIYAAASGKVVYCGNGLRGYGNLIIVKHNSLYLSAYAHNKKIFVRNGEWVKKGQVIAEMGGTGTDIVKLHFEIRRAGKPINPLSLYQSTSL